MTTTFDYGTARLRQFRVETTGKRDTVFLDDEPLSPTPRFWHSLQHRFGFTHNIFRLFTHAEVFARVTEKNSNDEVRTCVERSSSGNKLLAVSNPRSGAVPYDAFMDLVGRAGCDGHSYHNGSVRSTHAPTHADPFAIAGDTFHSKFVLDVPIDGYGKPAVYLSLLRQVCSNGAIAQSPVFRSELNVGRGGTSPLFALERAMEGFNNPEGYGALRQRWESATRSWASVGEAQRLYRLLARLSGTGAPLAAAGGDGAALLPASRSLLTGFHAMTGDLTRLYGMANLDGLSQKRQRTLPTACRVYDLLNFASEVATHHAGEAAARHLQAYIGSLVSGEYDLEGTADQFADWRDFFVKDAAAIETRAGL